jgi:hypothetical protein
MDQSAFYKLRNVLMEQNIVFCYSGYMTENILTALGETIKRKLEMEDADLTTTKRVFSIFVEQMQNVIRYSAEKITQKSENNNELRYGLIAIGNDVEGIIVHCGNLILNEDVEKMKVRVNELDGKDKDQLKKLYKQKMHDGPEKESKGASLGLVEMARRAGKPIEFDFEIINERHTFFSVKATV